MNGKQVLAAAGLAGAMFAAWIPGRLYHDAKSRNLVRPHYELVLAPGESPSTLQFDLQGVVATDIDSSGTLVLHFPESFVLRVRPYAYQSVANRRHDVAIQFAIDEHGDVRLVPGTYDRNLPLIIDPVVE